MHYRCPRVPFASYVDDLAGRAEGTRDCVVLCIADAACAVAPALQRAGLHVATKSTVVATDFKLARQ
eukprot:1232966-Alexandrium_andersonii.AAC.1